jgi:hypothetical protein
MNAALDIFFQIILGIAGAVFFGSLVVGGAAFGIGCALFGSCWGFFGWRRRRAARRKDGD